MKMFLQNVLFEYSEDNTVYSSSACMLNKRWIILPAASFIVFLTSKRLMPQALSSLNTSEIFFNNFLDLSTENIRIISTQLSTNNYKFQLAKYVGIFSCKSIKESTNFPLGCSHNVDSNLDFNTLMSLFIIFDVQMEEICQIDQFYQSVVELSKFAHAPLARGHQICIESSLFGVREFLSSYSQGIVCTCIGKNNIFIVTDAPTAPGSEGAPMFAFKNNNKNSMRIPIGIVVSSLNVWRGEHTGLTLGVVLLPLLTQLVPKQKPIQHYLFSNKNSVISYAEKSIVQVYCGNGWGTGILIDKKLGIFITASHVVNAGNVDKIVLKWRGNQFTATLIYRTQNSPYDIAIIGCSINQIEDLVPATFATKPAIKGDNVLAAGYPIFNSQSFIFPVVTKGNIALADKCILHTTCCILAGSSGGAILRENGELLGMIVCHVTVSMKQDIIVYPKINMAIPIAAVAGPLLEYIKMKDVNVLKSLESTDTYARNKWQLFQSKL